MTTSISGKLYQLQRNVPSSATTHSTFPSARSHMHRSSNVIRLVPFRVMHCTLALLPSPAPQTLCHVSSNLRSPLLSDFKSRERSFPCNLPLFIRHYRHRDPPRRARSGVACPMMVLSYLCGSGSFSLSVRPAVSRRICFFQLWPNRSFFRTSCSDAPFDRCTVSASAVLILW